MDCFGDFLSPRNDKFGAKIHKLCEFFGKFTQKFAKKNSQINLPTPKPPPQGRGLYYALCALWIVSAFFKNASQ